jgi:formylglycine-generating enzyme required for sulfatase activity
VAQRYQTAAEMREALRQASKSIFDRQTIKIDPQPAEPPVANSPDQPINPPDIAQPRGNRWKYAAAGVVLALAVGFMMFLNRNSSKPAKASSESTSLSLVPALTVADSPTLPASQTAALQSFTEDLGNGVKLEMLAIQGGSFTMGSEARAHIEQPHRVTVPSFCLGKYEVTQAQWKAVIGNNPSNFTDSDNLPVDSVSWNMAKEFCRKLSQMTGKNYRLPTEAEWEYACRAGTTGDYAGDPNLMAWSLDNSGQSIVNAGKFSSIMGFDYRNFRESNKNRSHPVGQKRPNAFGLHDMHGNVWEWCEDLWHLNYDGAPTDGSAWLSGDRQSRVLRGGGWADSFEYCRSASRDARHPDGNSHWNGFRVAVSAKTR